MTIINSTNDASKSVAILNSGDYPHRYADVTKAELRNELIEPRKGLTGKKAASAELTVSSFGSKRSLSVFLHGRA